MPPTRHSDRTNNLKAHNVGNLTGTAPSWMTQRGARGGCAVKVGDRRPATTATLTETGLSVDGIAVGRRPMPRRCSCHASGTRPLHEAVHVRDRPGGDGSRLFPRLSIPDAFDSS